MFITVVCVSSQKNLANIRKTMQAIITSRAITPIVNWWMNIRTSEAGGSWALIAKSLKERKIDKPVLQWKLQRKLPIRFMLAFSIKIRQIYLIQHETGL